MLREIFKRSFTSIRYNAPPTKEALAAMRPLPTNWRTEKRVELPLEDRSKLSSILDAAVEKAPFKDVMQFNVEGMCPFG